ncbi:MAG: phosphatase PAP2 family protein [Chloroflexota bacterium]
MNDTEQNKGTESSTGDVIKQALKQVQTPEQADEVIADLEEQTQNITEHQIAQKHQPTDKATANEAIREAATQKSQKPQSALLAAASQVVQTEGEDAEALSEELRDAVRTDDQETTDSQSYRERRLLQESLLRRLGPLSAADTALFLTINNNIPRTQLTDTAIRAISDLMNRGDGWVLLLLFAAMRDQEQGRNAFLDVLPALWLTTATVEYPVKSIFRRQRPFISTVRAVVVGRKPAGYSFPSGHSAAAFAGAWLMSRHYPQWRSAFYALATVVGFSRVYLGAHYPGDVATGAASGTLLAMAYRRLVRTIIKVLD